MSQGLRRSAKEKIIEEEDGELITTQAKLKTHKRIGKESQKDVTD